VVLPGSAFVIPWLLDGYSMAFPQPYTQRSSPEKSYPVLIPILSSICSGAYTQGYTHLLKKRAFRGLSQQGISVVYLACWQMVDLPTCFPALTQALLTDLSTMKNGARRRRVA
jgi:hypothetical protein